MVWGGISHCAKTDLVTVHGNLSAMRYCNKIVQPALLTFLRQGHATIFQEENARCHVARHTMDFLQANNMIVLDWPARSPDITPIEHLWDHLGRRVREMTSITLETLNVFCLKNGLAYQWLLYVGLFQAREDVVVLLLTQTVDTPGIDHWCDFQ